MVLESKIIDSKLAPIFIEVKQLLEDLYKEKLVDILLYGSYARGDYHEESDIDIALLLNDDINPFKEIDRIVDKIYDINLKHDVLFSVHPISNKKYLSQNTPFLINLKKEGISLCQK